MKVLIHLNHLFFVKVMVCIEYWKSMQLLSFLSFDPTTSPSNTPTLPPSNTPSISPTISPTFAPTKPPTQSPTRYPTKHNAYSKKLRINYEFTEINKDDENKLMDKNNFRLILEQAYVIVSQNYDPLEYRYFEILVNNQNGIMKTDNKLIIATNIYYESTVINLVTRTEIFRNYTQFKFRKYCNNSELLFKANIVNGNNETSSPFDYVLF
eukprot:226221_1